MPDSKFVIVYDDGHVRAVNEGVISNMYDMADCDAMEEVREVYACDENGRLVPVQVGPQERHDGWVEAGSGIYYATARIKAGKRTVGFVHFTDH